MFPFLSCSFGIICNHNQKRTATQKTSNKNKLPNGSAEGLLSRDRKENYRLNLPPQQTIYNTDGRFHCTQRLLGRQKTSTREGR